MLLKRSLLLGICLGTVTLGACTLSLENDRAAADSAVKPPDMNAFWAAHVADRQSGDLDATTSILAEDCVIFEPFQPPVAGLANIAPKLKKALSMTETHSLSFESREVHHQDGRLVDFGTFSETFSFHGSEDQHTVEGNYAAVLQQAADGDWKVKRYMVVPSTPVPSGS